MDGLQDRISGIGSCSCFPNTSCETDLLSKTKNRFQEVRTYYSVPGEASVVDYDVDLATSEFGGFLHKLVNVLCIQHISRNSCCLSATFFDGFGDCIRLIYSSKVHQLSRAIMESYGTIAEMYRHLYLVPQLLRPLVRTIAQLRPQCLVLSLL